MQKAVYEVLNEFKKAENKADRIAVLRNNDQRHMREYLTCLLHDGVQFEDVGNIEWRKEDTPAGMGYNMFAQEMGRLYLFIKNHPKCPTGLTRERRIELLIQLLEGMEDGEAEAFMNMVKKHNDIPYLTKNLVNEAYEGINIL